MRIFIIFAANINTTEYYESNPLIFAAVTLLFAVGCTGKSNKSQTDYNQTTDNMENTQTEQKEAVVYLTKYTIVNID